MIEAFERALEEAEVTRDPRTTAASAARAWNRAAKKIEGWPQTVLKAADRSRRYSLGWQAFPATLEADVDAWLANRAGDDIFSVDSPARPIGPATRRARKGAVLRFASAAVRSGIDPASLRTLADLVEIGIVKHGLTWLYEQRLDKRKTGSLANVAITLRTAARWHVGVDQKHLDALGAIVRQVWPRQVGMTPKNQARMEPLKDPEMVVRLLRLPETMIQGIRRGAPAETRALSFETALAIAILTYCPVRFGNLRSITIDGHIVRHGQGRGRRVLLHFPAEEVKNRQSATFELPPALVAMIDCFITVHRPALVGAPSRFLFTSRSADAPVDADTLSRRMAKAIRHHLGLDLSPHNFRHLSGLVYLSHHPAEFETVRRLLGHASSSTATDFYVGLETDAAHRAYVSLLGALRGDNDA
jgi:integrase